MMILLKNIRKLQIFTAEWFSKNDLLNHAYFCILPIFLSQAMLIIFWETFTTIKKENKLQDLIRLSDQNFERGDVMIL